MDKTLRCFIAIEIPIMIQSSLFKIIDKAHVNCENGFRPVRTGMIHLTLKFLGDVSGEQISAIQKRLSVTCKEFNPFRIQVSGLGAFPSWDHPRTLWAGLQIPPDVESFYQRIELYADELGFPLERRKFSPHLTLARVAEDAEPAKVKRCMGVLLPESQTQFGEVKVERVVLFSSTLQAGGSVYTPLSSHPFLALRCDKIS